MLRYKIDILEELRIHGVNSSSCRTTGQLAQSTFTYLKRKDMIGTKAIDQICSILRCQPGDLIEWVPDQEDK